MLLCAIFVGARSYWCEPVLSTFASLVRLVLRACPVAAQEPVDMRRGRVFSLRWKYLVSSHAMTARLSSPSSGLCIFLFWRNLDFFFIKKIIPPHSALRPDKRASLSVSSPFGTTYHRRPSVQRSSPPTRMLEIVVTRYKDVHLVCVRLLAKQKRYRRQVALVP